MIKKILLILILMLVCGSAHATDYYVDPDDGSDGNNGLTPGAAWETIAKATDTVAAGGSRVFIEGSVVFNTQDGANDCIFFNQQQGSGSANSENVYVGCSDINDVNDGGFVTIDGTGLTNCMKGTSDFTSWRNFRFINATGAGVAHSVENNQSYINCEFSNNGGDGLSGNFRTIISGCLFYDNGDGGAHIGDNSIVKDSIFWRNTGTGLEMAGGVVINCLAAENSGTKQMWINPASNLATVYGCIFDGNGVSVGLDADSTPVGDPYIISNCLFYDCDPLGLDFTIGMHEKGGDRNNCYYGNAGNTNVADRGDPLDSDQAEYYGNYVATSDPFGGDPGSETLAEMLASYNITSDEFPVGAAKGAGDLAVTKAYWTDVVASTNPPANAQTPRANLDIGGTQTAAGGGGSGTTINVKNADKNGGKQ